MKEIKKVHKTKIVSYKLVLISKKEFKETSLQWTQKPTVEVSTQKGGNQ